MSGIYIHIPFCKQACHYCNFHFSTSLKYKNELIAALLQEIVLRKDYLTNKKLQTIYFGGGTPSLLTADEINHIFEQLHRHFTIAPDAEVTLEANPDDLTETKVSSFKNTPINRLSIGIQSFNDEDLKLMNRAHTANQASDCIQRVQAAGFNNLTIDLIYGTPTMNNDEWHSNLDKALAFDIQHISAYCLTVELKTALWHMIKNGTYPAVNEEHAATQFEILVAKLTNNQFIHYEISNFCKKGWESKHNSGYWLGKHYLGLGPSAHSFNGHSRQENVPNNANYMKGVRKGDSFFWVEELNTIQQYNEYIMVALRTIWGCDLEKVQKDFGVNAVNYLLKNSHKFLATNLLKQENRTLTLTTQGRFLADGIISDLMMVD